MCRLTRGERDRTVDRCRTAQPIDGGAGALMLRQNAEADVTQDAASNQTPVLVVSTPSPMINQLIAALPPAAYRHLAPQLKAIDMRVGDVLHESGRAVSHAYFPVTSIVSLNYVLEDGASAEAAMVGNEGVVGVSIFMGGKSALNRAVVSCSGRGFRLPAGPMLEAFEQGGPVTHLLLRYTQALITQIAQMAVCNRHHTLDQRLCRWLLSTLDRLPTNELVVTQELIAAMLGVRREGVSAAASALQEAGLIRYARGRLTVVDRPGLERLSCECHAVVSMECRRLVTDAQAT